MAFEKVKRFRNRVRNISVTKDRNKSSTLKKNYAEKRNPPWADPSVTKLLELASTDWNKGETDLALFRLNCAMSTMEEDYNRKQISNTFGDKSYRLPSPPQMMFNSLLAEQQLSTTIEEYELDYAKSVSEFSSVSGDLGDSEIASEVSEFMQLVEQSFNMTTFLDDKGDNEIINRSGHSSSLEHLFTFL